MKQRHPFYDARWRKARAAFLATHPLCERCTKMGRTTAATVVNHRIPHKGSLALFWDQANWESTCKPHHDSTIQSEERTGFVKGNDASGRPLDPAHPWRQARKG